MEPNEVSEQKRLLVGEIMRMTVSMHVIKNRLAAERPDRAAYSLLFSLLESSKRASELAQLVHSDPSTVSRHISHLVDNGFAERVADRYDGRATLISLTEKGHDFCAFMRSQRETGLARLLSTWSDEDASRFCDSLRRFNEDVEAHIPNAIDDLRKVYEKAEASSENTSPSDKEPA